MSTTDYVATDDDFDGYAGEQHFGRYTSRGPGNAGEEQCDCGWACSWPDGTDAEKVEMLALWAEHAASCETHQREQGSTDPAEPATQQCPWRNGLGGTMAERQCRLPLGHAGGHDYPNIDGETALAERDAALAEVQRLRDEIEAGPRPAAVLGPVPSRVLAVVPVMGEKRLVRRRGTVELRSVRWTANRHPNGLVRVHVNALADDGFDRLWHPDVEELPDWMPAQPEWFAQVVEAMRAAGGDQS